jgi:hypothetical protein
VREALRIGFCAVAIAAVIVVSMTSPKPARAEDQAASFKDRWAITEPPPLRCGFRPSDKQEPVEDYETIERAQRARIKAILALPSREG